MTLSDSFARLKDVFFGEGALPALELIVRRLGGVLLGKGSTEHSRVQLLLVHVTDRIYDGHHKMDTGGVIDLPEMKAAGKNYVATAPRTWKLLLGHLPIDPSQFTYLDLGCGKGRTLCLASEMGFRRIIGVDISLPLIQVAAQNMGRQKIVNGAAVCRDVRQFDFPDEPLVIFMYNPFYEEIMRVVAGNLKNSVLRKPRPVWVVYYSAALKSVWDELGFLLFRASDAVYPNYAIYHYSSKDEEGAASSPGNTVVVKNGQVSATV